MTRLETACASVTLGFFLSSLMSVVGTSSMKSTSPARSAASRLAAEVIGRIVTFFQYGFLPQ